MKTLMNYLVMIGLLATSIVSAQVPRAFNYQAIIRDTTGVVIQDQLISLRITILKGEIQGEEVYQEIHDVTTDKFGLVNLNIGEGIETAGSFSEIAWGKDKFFLQIEMDMEGAMNYQLLGTSQLMAVPYALYAGNSGNKVWKRTDDGTIYYQDGKVGIGITNPQSRLHIIGKSELYEGRDLLLIQNKSLDKVSTSTLKLLSGNDSSATILQHNADTYEWENRSETGILWNNGKGLILAATREDGAIKFETGGAGIANERMRITNDGKVGIGTSNPQNKLHLEGTDSQGQNNIYLKMKNNSLDKYSNVEIRMFAGKNNSCLVLTHHAETYTGSQYGDYRDVSAIWNKGQGLVLRSSTTGRISFEVFDENADMFSEKMRMDGDGNFGIGILEPQRKLHINDVMRLEPRSTVPDFPEEGDIYMDSNDHVLKVYNGTEWKACW